LESRSSERRLLYEVTTPRNQDSIRLARELREKPYSPSTPEERLDQSSAALPLTWRTSAKMSDEHLNPNRGWTLINDSEQFTDAEIAHLKTCSQCGEWLSLFAQVARTAGAPPESATPFYVMADEHLTPARGWSLIRDRGQLEQHEFAHLQYCRRCNEWLKTFTRFAQKAGFTITFQIPPYDDDPRDV
jgi:hypothetical protein